jgi:hypothetical protein
MIKKKSILLDFEHFATKPDPVTEFIKLESTIIFKHFATNRIQ